MKKILALTPLLLLVAACGRMHRNGMNDGDAHVIFQNQSSHQAAVYATRTGLTPIRIGTVFALETDTLQVPSTLAEAPGTMQIYADLLAQDVTPSTGAITLGPGQAVEVTLNSLLGPLSVLPASIREP